MLRRLLIIIAVFAALFGAVVIVLINVALREQESNVPITGLDEARQKEIWAAEHATFQLETRFGKPFVEALSTPQNADATRFFRPEFEGLWPPSKAGEEQRVSHFREVALAGDGNSLERGDATELVNRLKLGMKGIAEVERARLRILHISTDNTTSGNDANEVAWRAELLLTVNGRDQDGQLAEYVSHHDAIFRLGDGEFVDSVVERWQVVDERLTYSSNMLMAEATKAAGLDQIEIPDNWTLPVEEVAAYRFQTAVGRLQPRRLARHRSGRETRSSAVAPWRC